MTKGLFQLFCVMPEKTGNIPLCSKTHQAWLNLADGTADIAILAAPTEEEQAYWAEKGVEMEMKLYGGDGLIFLGGKDIGISDLTLEEIRAIYRGEITNWSELGGADHVINVLYRDDQSGSQRLFESLIWQGEEHLEPYLLPTSRVISAMDTLVRLVEMDPYSIGYSVMTYLDDVFGAEYVQVFSINGVKPTPETIKDKSYPFGTQGYVVIRADEEENSPARKLYNWFGSPSCDDLLTSNGVTPLH